MQLSIGDRSILLNHQAKLPHHLGERLDFSKVIAVVNQHPTDPNRWGLQKILVMRRGQSSAAMAQHLTVPVNRSAPLRNG